MPFYLLHVKHYNVNIIQLDKAIINNQSQGPHPRAVCGFLRGEEAETQGSNKTCYGPTLSRMKEVLGSSSQPESQRQQQQIIH